MAKNLCPSCERPNALSARFCNGCGAVLKARCPQCGAANDATRSKCRDCGAALAKAAARARAPALASPPAARKRGSARAGASDASAAPDLKLVLLDIGDPPPDPRAHQPPKPELIRSDPEASLPPLPPLAEPPSPKSARRAAVRRAVIARATPEPDAGTGTHDVLVMDENEFARTQLCGLLEGFGFRAHAAASHDEVAELLTQQAFSAVFIDAVLEGSEAAAASELCRLVKSRRPPAGRAAALILVAGTARPADRVRATLVGADEFLVKPLQRGSIARALEACGVTLPIDPRRA